MRDISVSIQTVYRGKGAAESTLASISHVALCLLLFSIANASQISRLITIPTSSRQTPVLHFAYVYTYIPTCVNDLAYAET